MQKKIRTAQQQKIPFMVIAGDDDVAGGTVSFRYRDGSQRNGVPSPRRSAHVVEVVRSHSPRQAGRLRPRAARRAVERRRGLGGDWRSMTAARTRPTGCERLWTPHRMTYISGEDRPAGATSAHRLPVLPGARAPTRTSLVVARGEQVYAVLNLYPYNPGHLLVCPYRHVADYTDLDDGETAELAAFTQTAMRVIRAVSSAARLQPRHEPGRRWPAPASPRTCTSTWCRAGAATPTSCR